MSLQDTPRANRLHIGLYGKRNSGKSTLVNALTGQELSVVSDVAGTTTDPVYKSMELYGIGPVVFIDTAGFDDEGALGAMRVEKTKEAAQKTDIALMLMGEDFEEECNWIQNLKSGGATVIPILSKADTLGDAVGLAEKIKDRCGEMPLIVSAKDEKSVGKIREAIIRKLPEDYEFSSITRNLAKAGNLVLLVMPQDIQAPKGRLILPQVQTLRDLLDKKCMVMSCTTDKLEASLAALKNPPQLIVTDSQVFSFVFEHKPKESLLTSFSTLYAAYKGDISAFVEGAKAIQNLTAHSRILIAEACTHAPLAEDIGRVKIPRMLRQRYGEELAVDIVRGTDFPEDLSGYDLIVHCGGCMFNRKYVLSRIERAKAQGVPITNYGVAIAFLTGILDDVVYPE